MNGYFAIRRGLEVRIEGPVGTWQEAVLKAYGVIEADMQVKSLGTNAYWVTKKSWVNERISEREHWIRPYIPDSPLGIALTATAAWGPVEIATAMMGIASRIRDSKTLEEMANWHEQAIPMLRYMPVEQCAAFSDLYNAYRDVMLAAIAARASHGGSDVCPQ